MELMELSTQLKTVEIMDGESFSQPYQHSIEPSVEENRRITRSKTVPKSDVWTPTVDYPTQKTSNKVLESEDELKKIYLNNKIKIVHKNLETIFEDPVVRKGSTMFLGIGKQKRSLYLCREFRTTTKQKSKVRKSQIKRLGKRMKPFKMSDDEFKEKMMRIDEFINGDDIEKSRIENSTNCSMKCSNEMEIP